MNCEECGTRWDSQAAADECATLDAIEARNARRPARTTPRPARYWDDD